jgi:hypothetical protein
MKLLFTTAAAHRYHTTAVQGPVLRRLTTYFLTSTNVHKREVFGGWWGRDNRWMQGPVQAVLLHAGRGLTRYTAA